MRVSSLNRKLLRDLVGLRVQTLTLALLVISGVSLLVAGWSAYVSLKKAVNQYYLDYQFADVFADFKQAPAGIVDKVSQLPGVKQAEGRIQLEGLIDLASFDEPAVGRFISLSGDAQHGLNRLYLRKGNLPDPLRTNEIVVHEGFASVHKINPGDVIDVLIKGQRRTLNVVGVGISPETVYALSGSAPLPDNLHFAVVWGNRKLWEEMGQMAGAVNSVIATITTDASVEGVKFGINGILTSYGNLGAYDKTRQMSNSFIQDEIRQQKIMAAFSPGLFLSIAAFLVHVIISRLIATQRTQIATLKAIGYTGTEITIHYVKLVSVMMLLGAVPGIAIGGWLGKLMAISYRAFYHFPQLSFDIYGPSAVVGVFCAMVPGWIGAFSSLRSTFRMAPAEAMRPPAPVSFQPSLLEKIGLHKILGMRGRMILRNIMQRPFRLMMTILGMAAAVAIIIMAGFWMDLIEFMLDTQFQKAQREDISITLVKPSPPDILTELSHIEGIVATEGYRLVPVRVQYRNDVRDTMIMGYPDGAAMRHPLDVHGKEITLPGHGALVSRFFQKKWGLKTGDHLRMELLEGDLRALDVEVAGFSDDIIGNSVSMRAEELRRLLSEDVLFNVVTIKTDPRFEKQVYRELKKFPVIAAVQVKTLMYRGFMASMGGMILVSMSILVGFALCIAVGVIYNAVRVTFSERSWEIASLRVLGFKRFQVWTLLLGEVALQVGLALLPGCLLGLGLAHLSTLMTTTEAFAFPVIIYNRTYAFAMFAIILAFLSSMAMVWRMVKRLSVVDALKARD